jgi:hypothetical protein
MQANHKTRRYTEGDRNIYFFYNFDLICLRNAEICVIKVKNLYVKMLERLIHFLLYVVVGVKV